MLQTTARRAATVLALFVSLGTLSPFAAQQASAQSVASKQAEATRIAAQLERLAERASILTEDYNEARYRAAELDARAANAAKDFAATEAKAQTAKTSLKQMSIEAYIRGGRPAVQMAKVADRTRAEYYLQSAANRQQDTIDALRAAKLLLAERQEGLDAARAQARRTVNQVDAKRRAAEAAESQQRAVLARVKGDLAQLVAQDRARRDAANRRPAATTRANRNRPNLNAPPGTDAPAPNAGAGAAVAEAKRQVGKPYKWGGSGPENFDCSGLTSWVWREGGKSLPHSSRAQYSATSRVSVNDIAPGDLTFYGKSVSGIHHVGIYVGGGQMISAPQSGDFVKYQNAFRKDLIGIGRVN
ncbi:MAG: NlpC/P60 family protein [Acidimicrobiales bacterium]|nr:NlpC/P60 family protein [Acidimicrobiales bacterium]